MFITTALVALHLVAAQANEPQTGGLTVGGKQIPLRLVATPEPSLPADLGSWKGWQIPGAQAGALFKPYRAVRDWQNLTAYAKPTEGATPWRAKIVVFARTERVGKDENGVLRAVRQELDPTQLQQVLESVARFVPVAQAESGGALRFVPEVTVEQEMMRVPADQAAAEFARRYFGPRINGGRYEAEDQVFRGPYQGVYYVWPGPGSVQTHTVNGTPVSSLPTQYEGFRGSAGELEAAFASAFAAQASARLAWQGYRASDAGERTPELWRDAATTEPASAEALAEHAKKSAGAAKSVLDITSSAIADGLTVALVDDEQRGKVLKLSESYGRSGGLGLPLPSASTPTVQQAPTLSLFVKSKDGDPMSIRVQGSGKTAWLSIGRSPIPGAGVLEASFTPNGEWQKVAFDLRPLGITKLEALAIEPSPEAMLAGDRHLAGGEYFFDEIKLSDEPAPAAPTYAVSLTSPDDYSRAVAASRATQSSPELIAALRDPSDLVRLNATAAYTRFKDPAAEPNLITNAGDLQETIQDMALRALAHLGTDTAWNRVRQVLRFSLSPHARATAAAVLGETKESRYSGDVLLLFAGPGWQPKIAAVHALATMGADPRLRLGFLRHEVPAVRLETVLVADTKNPDTVSALEWHQVNDPSDLVRANAAIRLIESGNAKAAESGYKAVRDDSHFVRVLVLDHLASKPAAAHRAAILIGLADRFPTVRAAALRALAAQPGDVKLEELTSLLQDRHPEVQLALLQLAKTKSLRLPEATVRAMRESFDPRVQAAAGG